MLLNHILKTFKKVKIVRKKVKNNIIYELIILHSYYMFTYVYFKFFP